MRKITTLVIVIGLATGLATVAGCGGKSKSASTTPTTGDTGATMGGAMYGGASYGMDGAAAPSDPCGGGE